MPEVIKPWTASPQTRPIAVGDPRVLRFPFLRAPRGDHEGASGTLNDTASTLKKARVLLVEDDFIVAFDMQMLLEEQGADVIGPAASLKEAGRLLNDHKPNIAVLDVNLNGELVFPLIDALQARGIPFVFTTAYAEDDRLFPAQTQGAPRLAKPVLPNVLVAQLEKMLR